MDLGLTKETIDLSVVRYEKETGLVPVVVQDVDTGAVLMVAYANREALKRTLATGQAWFWSRSRQDYWRKGATSGNVQTVEDVRVDCDGDTILYLVHPAGPACHTGERSCFYRTVSHGEPAKMQERTDDDALAMSNASSQPSPSTPATDVIESSGSDGRRDTKYEDKWTGQRIDELIALWETVDSRYTTRPDGSYTTYLFTQGTEKISKKVGEEAVEVALASLSASFTENANAVVSESADLMYHLFVLWRALGVSPEQVLQKLADR